MKKYLIMMLVLVSSVCMAQNKVAPYSIVMSNKFGVPVNISLASNIGDKLVCTVSGIDQPICHDRSGYDNFPSSKPLVIPADSNLTITVYPLTEGSEQYNGEVNLYKLWSEKKGVCYSQSELGYFSFDKASTIDITDQSFFGGSVFNGPC